MFTPFFCHWKTGPVPPFVATAANVTAVPGQVGSVPEDSEIVAVGVTTWLTVTVMLLEVMLVGFAQVALDVSVQVTISALLSVDEVKPVPVPTVVEPTFHSYVGLEPPPKMEEEKLTVSPAHIVDVPPFSAMDISGVTVGVIVNVTPLLVAVAGFAHVALDVTWQVTTGLPVKVLLVKVALVSPFTALPFTYH